MRGNGAGLPRGSGYGGLNCDLRLPSRSRYWVLRRNRRYESFSMSAWMRRCASSNMSRSGRSSDSMVLWRVFESRLIYEREGRSESRSGARVPGLGGLRSGARVPGLGGLISGARVPGLGGPMWVGLYPGWV